MASASGQQKKKVMVLGASGQVGQATLQAIGHECTTDSCEIAAGSRKPGKVQSVAEKHGSEVDVQHTDMSDKSGLMEKLKDFDSVFIITPGDESRSEITCSAIDACKAANVKFVLLMSITMVGSNTLFGKQFGPIEDHLKKSGMNYAILRAPSFIDNLLNFRDEILRNNCITAPVDGDKNWTPVAVKDVGSLAAHILVNCDKYKNQTFVATMPSITYNDMAQTFSRVLGRQITFKKVSAEEFQKQLNSKMPEYAAKGTAEIYQLMQSGQKDFINIQSDDIKKVTGHDAMTMESWLTAHRQEFASVGA